MINDRYGYHARFTRVYMAFKKAQLIVDVDRPFSVRTQIKKKVARDDKQIWTPEDRDVLRIGIFLFLFDFDFVFFFSLTETFSPWSRCGNFSELWL